jgi:hypothetical protein
MGREKKRGMLDDMKEKGQKGGRRKRGRETK